MARESLPLCAATSVRPFEYLIAFWPPASMADCPLVQTPSGPSEGTKTVRTWTLYGEDCAAATARARSLTERLTGGLVIAGTEATGFAATECETVAWAAIGAAGHGTTCGAAAAAALTLALTAAV